VTARIAIAKRAWSVNANWNVNAKLAVKKSGSTRTAATIADRQTASVRREAISPHERLL
jgi:hypothetical protein